MTRTESVARALCIANGQKPDTLIPIRAVRIDTPPPDGYDDKGFGGNFLWRTYMPQAAVAVDAYEKYDEKEEK